MEDFQSYYSEYDGEIYDFETKINSRFIRNNYELLVILIEKFKEKNLPKYAIFFSKYIHKESGNELTAKTDFTKLFKQNKNDITIEVKGNSEYNEIEKDSSIIAILHRLTEHFLLIMKSLTHWDEKLNILNKDSISFAINQLASVCKITDSYLNENKVKFLNEEYKFTSYIV